MKSIIITMFMTILFNMVLAQTTSVPQATTDFTKQTVKSASPEIIINGMKDSQTANIPSYAGTKVKIPDASIISTNTDLGLLPLKTVATLPSSSSTIQPINNVEKRPNPKK